MNTNSHCNVHFIPAKVERILLIILFLMRLRTGSCVASADAPNEIKRIKNGRRISAAHWTSLVELSDKNFCHVESNKYI